MNKTILLTATVSGFLAVALGAFGAHGLKNIAPAELISIFKLGVEYQFYHTFALLALGICSQWINTKQIVWSAWCFVIGMVFFSGSLYLYALTGVKWVGPITPIGGTFLLIGWLLFAYSVSRLQTSQTK
ncbi:DUF423 domain-containing protein [Shewanella maritima]|uniref:DUF423 domain-containing protein n=1 Tax=Shewanella maritima TaxID=2520507 RepID=A0A411PEB9_9GAMM|nr:DUF423 domain-containing protein [Shewanella maritima]QBF81812.1 DUF423 domain-containing protein [Shewanella maritima]